MKLIPKQSINLNNLFVKGDSEDANHNAVDPFLPPPLIYVRGMKKKQGVLLVLQEAPVCIKSRIELGKDHLQLMRTATGRELLEENHRRRGHEVSQIEDFDWTSVLDAVQK
jgi:molybdate-binding protein